MLDRKALKGDWLGRANGRRQKADGRCWREEALDGVRCARPRSGRCHKFWYYTRGLVGSVAKVERRGATEGRFGGIARRWRNQQCSHEVLTFFFSLPRPNNGPHALAQTFPDFPGTRTVRSLQRANRGERRSSRMEKEKFRALSITLARPSSLFFLLLRTSFLSGRFLPGDELYSRSRYENVTPRPSGKVRSRIYSSGILAESCGRCSSFGFFLSFLSYTLYIHKKYYRQRIVISFVQEFNSTIWNRKIRKFYILFAYYVLSRFLSNLFIIQSYQQSVL